MENLRQKIEGLSPQERIRLEQQLLSRVAAGESDAIPRRSAQGPWPLSFAQQRLWFLDQFEPGLAVYNLARALTIQGPLDVAALERALTAILARHESLRTIYAGTRHGPVQTVRQAAPLALPMIEIPARRAQPPQAELAERLKQDAARPFDLARDRMLRATLYRLGPEHHTLLLTMHHIASDGWSRDIVCRELAELYTAFRAGRPVPLEELPIQYIDYTLWQKRRLEGAALEALAAYWAGQLAGAPALLELPTDRPRPARQTYGGARLAFDLSPDLVARLSQLGRERNATPFMVFLTAFQTLLARMSGQEDICVGSPIAGRGRLEVEGLVGFFVNTLVLRNRLSESQTFHQCLAKVRDTTLSAYAHQEMPFEKLVERLSPQRSLSYSPLIQVLFAYQNVPAWPLELPGARVQVQEVDTGTARFDLALALEPAGDGLRAVAEYNTDLFDAATMARMMTHYRTLLEGITGDPDMRLSDLPLLDEPQRRQMLVAWNATAAKRNGSGCVHELFERQVQRNPDSVAVAFEGRQLTYAQLNARANQLARRLRGLGVGPDRRVGLCVERSLEMVVGLLGILKAGGAYVPLDPSYPAARLAFMLQDARPAVLLTQQRLAARLPSVDVPVLYLDREEPALSAADGANLPPLSAPGDLAYVIYTSGSTGKPKGVMIQHGALANFLKSMQQRPGLTECDVLLAVTTICFDIAGLEIYLPLISGGKVVVADAEDASDPARLAALLEASGATVMQATPAIWRMLLQGGWRGKGDLRMFCGGEALPRDLADRLLEKGRSLWNLYGPTETTVWSTLEEIHAGQEPITIGRPIDNTQIYILDKHLHPVPIGVAGELHIGGEGLARGYLDRPELTAEKFIRDPFHPRDDARLYKTGDMARYRPDGRIEHLGRLDQQLKIRGFRIEPGEIEAVLQRHPAVRQCVVVVHEHAGDRRLAAYLVCDPAAPPSPRQLREHLLGELPEYMMPAWFIPLDALPRTPNGKIDRAALPSPQAAPSAPAQSRQLSATENLLMQIWREVLVLPHVGVSDNFFELGGHSLLATQITTRLREALGVELPLLEFFDTPTIAELAAKVDRLNPGTGSVAAEAIPVVPRQARLARRAADGSLSSPKGLEQTP